MGCGASNENDVAQRQAEDGGAIRNEQRPIDDEANAVRGHRNEEGNEPAVHAGGGAGGGPLPPDDEGEDDLKPLPPIPLEMHWTAGTHEGGSVLHGIPSQGPYVSFEKIPSDASRAKRIVFGSASAPQAWSPNGSELHVHVVTDAAVTPGERKAARFNKKFDIPRLLKNNRAAAEATGRLRRAPSSSGADLLTDVNRVTLEAAEFPSCAVAKQLKLGGDLPAASAGDEVAEAAAAAPVAAAANDKEAHFDGPQFGWNSGAFVARAFYPHSLCDYSVGWVKVDLAAGQSLYSVQVDGSVTPSAEEVAERERVRQKENENEKRKQDDEGGPPPTSSVSLSAPTARKYFLYPEVVEEVGLYLSIGGIPISTDAFYRLSHSPADFATVEDYEFKNRRPPLSGAFFTFDLSRSQQAQFENSMSLLLYPPLNLLKPKEIHHIPGGAAADRSIDSVNVSIDSTSSILSSDDEGLGGQRRVKAKRMAHSYTEEEKRCWLTFRRALNEQICMYLAMGIDRYNQPAAGKGGFGVEDERVVPLDLHFSLKFRYPNQQFRMHLQSNAGAAASGAAMRSAGGATLLFTDSSRPRMATSKSVASGDFTLCLKGESSTAQQMLREENKLIEQWLAVE